MNKNDLKIGMVVSINPRDDRSREVKVIGEVAELLTKSLSHPHGIMVRLKSGEIGRVKEIISKYSRDTSKQEYDSLRDSSIEEIISKGENHFIEFKSSMLWSENLTQEEIKKMGTPHVQKYGCAASKVIIASTIAGFLNTDGGDLFIGIKENKDTKKDEIIGIESEYEKLKDPCDDGYRRKILDTIIKPYFPSFIFNHFNDYLKIEFAKINNKVICRVNIKRSDEKVFIKLQKTDNFFIRVDASTRQLQGKESVDYCMKRFS